MAESGALMLDAFQIERLTPTVYLRAWVCQAKFSLVGVILGCTSLSNEMVYLEGLITINALRGMNYWTTLPLLVRFFHLDKLINSLRSF